MTTKIVSLSGSTTVLIPSGGYTDKNIYISGTATSDWGGSEAVTCSFPYASVSIPFWKVERIPGYPSSPGQPYIPPTPAQVTENHNDGWDNSCSSSVDTINPGQEVALEISHDSRGFFVGLATPGREMQWIGSYKFGVRFTQNGLEVFESNISKFTLAGGLSPGDIISIRRYLDGSVAYKIGNTTYKSDVYLDPQDTIYAYAIGYEAYDQIVSALIRGFAEAYVYEGEIVFEQKVDSYCLENKDEIVFEQKVDAYSLGSGYVAFEQKVDAYCAENKDEVVFEQKVDAYSLGSGYVAFEQKVDAYCAENKDEVVFEQKVDAYYLESKDEIVFEQKVDAYSFGSGYVIFEQKVDSYCTENKDEIVFEQKIDAYSLSSGYVIFEQKVDLRSSGSEYIGDYVVFEQKINSVHRPENNGICDLIASVTLPVPSGTDSELNYMMLWADVTLPIPKSIKDEPIPPRLTFLESVMPPVAPYEIEAITIETGELESSVTVVAPSIAENTDYNALEATVSLPVVDEIMQYPAGYMLLYDDNTAVDTRNIMKDVLIPLHAGLKATDNIQLFKDIIMLMTEGAGAKDTVGVFPDREIALNEICAALDDMKFTIDDLPDYAGGTAWVMNIDTGATSLFLDYGFNSFIELDGIAYGVSGTDIWKLQETSVPVPASGIDYGLSNLGSPRKKRIPHFYASVASTGKVFLRLLVDGARAEYFALSSTDYVEPNKINTGRGFHAVYWNPIIIAPEGVSIEELDSLEWKPMTFDRRV